MNRKRIIGLTILLIVCGLPIWGVMSGLLRMRNNARLIQATKLGNLQEVESLLRRGSDPNSRDYDDHLNEIIQSSPANYGALQMGMSPWSGNRRMTVLECAVHRDRENAEL